MLFFSIIWDRSEDNLRKSSPFMCFRLFSPPNPSCYFLQNLVTVHTAYGVYCIAVNSTLLKADNQPSLIAFICLGLRPGLKVAGR